MARAPGRSGRVNASCRLRKRIGGESVRSTSQKKRHRAIEAVRTTGLAMLQTGQALAYVASSVVFGVLWQGAGVRTACLAAAGVAVLLLPLCAVLLRTPRSDR